MFSKQISIKNLKLFAVNNFVQLCKVLRDLKPWKILTFFLSINNHEFFPENKLVCRSDEV